MKEIYIKQHIALDWFFYPVAKLVSKSVSPKYITPNLVTLAWYSLMIVGTVVHLYHNLGQYIFVIFFVVYFLDCLDGQIARDYNLTSKRGKFLDDFGGDMYTLLFWVCYGVYTVPVLGGKLPGLFLGIYLGVISILRSAMAYRAANAQATLVSSKANSSDGDQRIRFIKRAPMMIWNFGELAWVVLPFVMFYGFEFAYLVGGVLIGTMKLMLSFYTTGIKVRT